MAVHHRPAVETMPDPLSWTVHKPPGNICSASPAELSEPGRGVERMPASDRLPLESSSVAASREAKGSDP